MKNYLFITLFLISGLNLKAQAAMNPFASLASNDQNIVLLNNGLASFEERLQMIERAQTSIDIEYFIYRHDKSGRIFTHALIKKAKEGVKVRMLLDFFKVQSDLGPFYAHELEKAGIEIKYYNPTPLIKFVSGQYRNHRKTLLIDGKEVITGGRNLGDEYFDMEPEYNFLDRDIKIEGDLVQSVKATFEEMWNSELSKKVARDRMPLSTDAKYNAGYKGTVNGNYSYDINQWKKKVATAVEFATVPMDASFEKEVRLKGQANLDLEYRGTCSEMAFHSEYPIIGSKSKNHRMLKFEIAEKIKNAQKSIIFDSPYFVMDKTAQDALASALSNKLDVKLITNSLYSTDAVYVSTAFNSIVKTWIKKGLKPYVLDGKRPAGYPQLNDEFGNSRVGVHAKSYVFDDKDVIIGTFNFDPRSANLNTEMIVSCDNNPELADAVTSDMQMRMKSSIFLDTPEKAQEMKFYNVGLIKKIEFALLHIPSRLLNDLL